MLAPALVPVLGKPVPVPVVPVQTSAFQACTQAPPTLEAGSWQHILEAGDIFKDARRLRLRHEKINQQ